MSEEKRITFLMPYNVDDYYRVEAVNQSMREIVNLISIAHNAMLILSYAIVSNNNKQAVKELNTAAHVFLSLEANYIAKSQKLFPNTLDVIVEELTRGQNLGDDAAGIKALIEAYLLDAFKEYEKIKKPTK